MSETTGIEWTDATWNPWIGCHRVSPGCARCYAERLVNGRMGGKFSVVRRAAPATFDAPRRWANSAWGPNIAPRRVFTCSLSDFFIEEADIWRPAAWDIIRYTPGLTYQILTKRPERIRSSLPNDWAGGWRNVWLGVSGETVELAAERGEILSAIPARVRFLSAEPWLEQQEARKDRYDRAVGMFDWVILGGESGPGSRPMSNYSARLLRDACLSARIPFFLKQLGGNPNKRSHGEAVLDGQRWTQFPRLQPEASSQWARA